VLYRGELPRADAAGAGERHTRRIVSALLERGVLTADSARAAPPRLPRDPGRALDAGIVSREDGLDAPSLPPTV
jgi:hypothetical protein